MSEAEEPTATAELGALDLLGRLCALLTAAPTDHLDEAINAALEHLGTYVDVDRAFVLLLSADKQSFTATHQWCAPGIPSDTEYFIDLPITVFPWTVHQVLAGQVVAIDSVADCPTEAEHEQQIYLQQGTQSVIFAPMTARGEVLGAVGFDAIRSPKQWGPHLIHALQISSALIALRIDEREVEADLARASDSERRTLGQNIHDSLGQEMTAITLVAAALKKALRTHDSSLSRQAADIESHAQSAMKHIRSITQGLDGYGVVGAPVTEILANLAAETGTRMGVACTFTQDGAPPIEDPETCTQLVWIAREAVNNAIRHGKAKHVAIALNGHDEKPRLTVSDDGVGLPEDNATEGGIGLRIMRFRAAAIGGRITLQPVPEGGTRVCCVFPAAPR